MAEVDVHAAVGSEHDVSDSDEQCNLGRRPHSRDISMLCNFARCGEINRASLKIV